MFTSSTGAEDGSFVSSGYRSVAHSDILEAPFVAPEQRDVFHVGPVNMKRAWEKLEKWTVFLGKIMEHHLVEFETQTVLQGQRWVTLPLCLFVKKENHLQAEVFNGENGKTYENLVSWNGRECK